MDKYETEEQSYVKNSDLTCQSLVYLEAELRAETRIAIGPSGTLSGTGFFYI